MRFPNESEQYRVARERLLTAELELKRATETVAEERRRLPPGGEVPVDYSFARDAGSGSPTLVPLSGLFAPGKDVLAVYSFMYGPEQEQPCGACTSIVDALDGEAPHIEQRINLAIVGRAPLERLTAFATGRGWRNVTLVSAAENTYNRDYLGETEDGDQMPMLNVFQREAGGTIRHTWGSELLSASADAGQNERHVDFIWPLWNVFDATPIGRGKDWQPSVSYG